MRVYRVDVTQDDIAHGVRGNARQCPIARAWNRATGGGLSLYLPTTSLPPVAQQFMARFDAGQVVHPITFEMEVW